MKIEGEKIKVTLRITESLLSIFRDRGFPLEETLEICLDEPATLRSIISGIGVSPILVPMVKVENKLQFNLNYLVKHDDTITLIGPLAGG